MVRVNSVEEFRVQGCRFGGRVRVQVPEGFCEFQLLRLDNSGAWRISPIYFAKIYPNILIQFIKALMPKTSDSHTNGRN